MSPPPYLCAQVDEAGGALSPDAMSDRSCRHLDELEADVAAAEPVDVVDDRDPRLRVVERAARLEEERATLGTERLGAIQDRDRLDALERRGQLGNGNGRNSAPSRRPP